MEGTVTLANGRLRKGIICLAVGLVVAGYAARTVSAQVLYGSIVGTLTDETGAVVPGAVVTVKNTSTGLSREATTDETGHYAIQNLLEGAYDLSVSASGFKPYTQTGVEVSINSVTRVDIKVQVGAITDQVTVEGSSQRPPDDEVGRQHASGYGSDRESAAVELPQLPESHQSWSLGPRRRSFRTRSPTRPGAR